MDDYIKRKDALDVFSKHMFAGYRGNGKSFFSEIVMPTFYRAIEDLPSADVAEIKYGYWIEEEYSIEDDWGVNNYHYHICSECHERISNDRFSKSWVCCPYCGADMRKEKK